MQASATYVNPVWDGYFADPFVWRHGDEYFAIGTGPAEAAGAVGPRVFPLLRSPDLATWRAAGHALVRPDAALGDAYWAPEVAYAAGTFFLYYSVGHQDAGHQLRVATSPRPEGPYVDAGHALVDPGTCAFAIDPHPFRDDDGRWYLFYARDFLDAGPSCRAGTALVVEPLDGMTRLAGTPTVVLRARHDWQRFARDRAMYGGRYDWHTLEGPAVLRHDGRHYCFYSGGRWETADYGVDYAVAAHVLGPYDDRGAEHGPRVLRSAPPDAVGPGHNSFVVGPDGDTVYVAYHAWDGQLRARRMFVDRLVWTSAGPRCLGPTTDPQPRPGFAR